MRPRAFRWAVVLLLAAGVVLLAAIASSLASVVSRDNWGFPSIRTG